MQAVQDACAIVLDFVRNVGSLVNSILHLDLAGVIADLGNIAINLGQAVVWVVRVGTGAYFGAAVSDYFMRDRALGFIRTLIIQEFGKKEGEDILSELGWGTVHFGLPITASARIMRADSNSFPFVDLHNDGDGTLDLFAMASLLSFNSFRIARERTRVVRVDDNGNDMWYLPVHRYAIRSFLDSGGTSMRLRAYGMEPQAMAKGMRTARKKFKKLCIYLGWDTPFNFPTFQQFNTQPCTNRTEFRFFNGGTIADARWFAVNTPRNGGKDQDATPLSIGIFGYADGKNGLCTGRDIKRNETGNNGCDGASISDACISRIQRTGTDFLSLDEDGDRVDDHLPTDPCGCGVTWRDAYPPWFSRLVLAHELGHYFGLAHAGHNGVQNIMFSNKENAWFDGDSWRLWMHGDANFVEEDVEHAWRFIVKEMPHVLRAL